MGNVLQTKLYIVCYFEGLKGHSCSFSLRQLLPGLVHLALKCWFFILFRTIDISLVRLMPLYITSNTEVAQELSIILLRIFCMEENCSEWRKRIIWEKMDGRSIPTKYIDYRNSLVSYHTTRIWNLHARGDSMISKSIAKCGDKRTKKDE